MKLLTRSDAPDANLGILERFAYMSGGTGTAILNGLLTGFILFYYTDVIGLNGAIVGLILLVSRILDGLSDLVMGTIVDRTHSKYGKARVWIIRGCIPYAISGILLFSVPAGVSGVMPYIFVIITYNLASTIMYTGMSVPYNAMLVNITSNPMERGLLGVFSQLAATLGNVIVNSTVNPMVAAFGGTPKAWQLAGVVYVSVGLVLHLLCFFFTKERNVVLQKKDEKQPSAVAAFRSLFRNRYWLLGTLVCLMVTMIVAFTASSAMYYANAMLGSTSYYAPIANAMALSNIVGVILFSVLMKKLGKRNTMLVGAFGLLIACVLNAATGNVSIVIFANGMKGFCGGLTVGGIYGVIADTIDYSEWKDGIKAEGTGMAGMTFGTKVATGMATSVTGLLVGLSSYSATAAVQSADALVMVNIVMNVIPAALCIIMIIALAAYKLDAIYADIHKDLAKRRAGEGGES